MFQSLKQPMKPGVGRGFTLIELMVVIAVMAALVTLTAPSFKRMIDMQRLRSLNAALVTDLQFARSEAASRGQLVYVRFDKSGSALTCYVILAGDSTACDCKNTPGTNVCVASAAKEIRTVQVDRSSGITVGVPDAQTLSTLAFDPATGRLLVVALDTASPPTEPFVVEVSNPAIGAFRDSLEATGRPTVCATSSQITGVSACP